MKEITLFVLMILLAIGLLFGLAYWIATAECNMKTQDMRVPHQYKVIGGCFVQQDGLWIPVENWRVGQ